jgi:serine/threonine protein kinase
MSEWGECHFLLHLVEFEFVVLTVCVLGVQSLLDTLRRRKRYSEAEARFYLVQLVCACEYMHAHSVIHRDLKLGNLMFDEDMNLKVGDFGLAALVKFPGERKKCVFSRG